MAVLFGRRVSRLRQRAGLTQEELAAKIFVVRTRISQIEGATGARPTLDLARKLDDVLDADGLLVDLWPYVRRESFPDWSQRFIDLSAKALEIRQYAAHVVPGLLQTPEYARALLRVGRTLRSQQQLDERLAARLDRQARLRGPDAPEMWVVLDESVLRREVGGSGTMRAQILRLLRDGEAGQKLTIQVLPFSSGEHSALGGSLTLLRMPDGSRVAYTEGADSGQLVEEAEEVEGYAATYDRLRALALPPAGSADLLRDVVEESRRASRAPTRPERRHLAQVQLQQSGGRRLRRGGRPIPRPGAGA
ncbi:helix-turn-helix domain-containing protein [Streptomyces daliensis]|uniref:Helix-turn-helix transcriptional regulator n=1 Tax=Streptomyces daliensis TaxID=299421 RepID=A0A8T4IUC4_9ACTN|nr:helix-turn-helix transcriptional regulator [Streptomyces daliensis]